MVERIDTSNHLKGQQLKFAFGPPRPMMASARGKGIPPQHKQHIHIRRSTGKGFLTFRQYSRMFDVTRALLGNTILMTESEWRDARSENPSWTSVLPKLYIELLSFVAPVRVCFVFFLYLTIWGFSCSVCLDRLCLIEWFWRFFVVCYCGVNSNLSGFQLEF